MNREEHLRRNLPRWLELPQLAEIVIVDWSNQRPLHELRSIDARVKIVRVDGEAKWILSYAYNVGVSHATQPVIVKCDADCVPHRDAVTLFQGSAGFYAGHWRSGAAVNKPSVNGQCIFTKTQFEAVNGYSELIRTYGRDDEDFYDRLIAAGFARREIVPALLDFIGHTDGDRTANQFAASRTPTAEQTIFQGLPYNEMHNAYIARCLPWGGARPRSRYREIRSEERLVALARDQAEEIQVPMEVEQGARLFALRYLATTAGNLPAGFAERLDERACLTLIASRMKPVAPRKASSGQLVKAT